ncbi:MAG: SUMF1/EgtB/PvdO family nonheme iron enzyme [Deltaproteobacteria bacterium]|nr:SUMF1/EgtB/PvdO family nonheme iron enzyme [Deltaproteobacteria bacterium]
MINQRHALALTLLMLTTAGCLVEESCKEDRDCAGVKLCNKTNGACEFECSADADCDGDAFYCEGHTCHLLCDNADLACPEGMASICGAFCIDVYEASRPDATAQNAGSDSSIAVSQPGVIPWHSGDLTEAEAAVACSAAGKRLCTGQEWVAACAGLGEQVYVYGNEYEPTTCNGIDNWCDPECGIFQWCYMECDHNEAINPTGSFESCTNEFGIYDMSGNTWEAVSSTDGKDHFHGGAFDCGDPALAHQCGYDGIGAGPFPATRGFRCCTDGDPPG